MSWYAINTIRGSEKRATSNLFLLNYYAYCPLIPKDKRFGKEGTEPAFPGYTFVSMKEGQDDFHAIKHTPGVLKLVSLTRRDGYLFPTALPDGLIESMMERENWEGHKSEYSEGDRVRFTDGPFNNYEAEITRIMSKQGEERIFLLIEAIGKGVRIEANTNDIEPLIT